MQLVIVTDLMKWWNDDQKYFIFNDEDKNADMRNVKCQFIDMEIDKKKCRLLKIHIIIAYTST